MKSLYDYYGGKKFPFIETNSNNSNNQHTMPNQLDTMLEKTKVTGAVADYMLNTICLVKAYQEQQQKKYSSQPQKTTVQQAQVSL